MTEAAPRSHQSPVKYQPNIGPIRPITEQILEFQVQLKDRQQTGSYEIPHRTASLWPVGPCKSQGGASRRRRDYTVLRAACRELAPQIERELRFPPKPFRHVAPLHVKCMFEVQVDHGGLDEATHDLHARLRTLPRHLDHERREEAHTAQGARVKVHVWRVWLGDAKALELPLLRGSEQQPDDRVGDLGAASRVGEGLPARPVRASSRQLTRGEARNGLEYCGTGACGTAHCSIASRV